MMTFDRDIGIGIVGCGMISAVQVDAFRKVSGARVVAFHDAVPAAAMARATQFGGTPHIHLQDLLANPDVDAVSICTPSGLHLEAAIQAARAGKHVIVEKPLEVTVDRVDAILDACRASGVTLAAVFPRRFFGSSQALKRAIDAGRFGTVVLATVHVKWYRSPEYYASGGWRGTYRYDGGGVLMNQGIHGIDLLQWLMGGVREVAAFTTTRAHPGIEVEDTAVASLVFRSGALGAIEGTTGAWPGERIRIEISGTEGSAVLEDETLSAWRFRSPRSEDDEIRAAFGPQDTDGPGGATDPKAIDSEGHRRQFEDFVGALRDRRAPQVDGAEGRAAVAIVTAVYRSAREGRPVAVDSR
ncbi:MAG TPA: Gfo/Idh/MocA family oxidoreductase [Polyangiaceae bacterium]|jgi:predicted dehydrogenase